MELLVCVAILSVLFAILLPSLGSSKRKALRTACSSNLRQLISGCLLYAHDQENGELSISLNDGDDNQSFLYPDYIAAAKSFVCPETRNQVRNDVFHDNVENGRRELKDLSDYPGGPEDFGTSYELFGFMNATPDLKSSTAIDVKGITKVVNGTKKTLPSVESYSHKYNAFGFSGVIPGPSRIWLLLDGDGRNGKNYPSRNSNHGEAGANVSFCDGHVEWVPRTTYVESYEMSQDENRFSP